MNRILIVNLAVGTPRHGTVYRPHLLARRWAEEGRSVRFIGAGFSHLMTSPPPESREELAFDEDGVDYRLVPIRRYQGSGAARVQAVLQTWQRGGRAIVRHAEEFRPDLILATTVYQLDNFGAIEAARRTRAVALRETRDLWPLTIKEMSRTWRLNPLVPLIQRAEDAACRQMHGVMSTLPNAFEHFASRGLAAEKFYYIPQAAPDSAAPQPLSEDIRKGLEELRSQAEVLLIYAGSLVPSNNLMVILDALSAAGPSFRLAVFGEGPERERMERSDAAARGMVRFFGQTPRGSIPSALVWADAGVMSLAALDLYRFGASPNKVVEYLSAGLPCIMQSPGRAHMVAESGGGIAVSDPGPEALAAAFRSFAEMPVHERQALGKLGQAYIQENCTVSKVAEQVICAAESARDRSRF